MNIEYKITVRKAFGSDGEEEWLKEQGKEGWELVSVLFFSVPQSYKYYFRRVSGMEIGCQHSWVRDTETTALQWKCQKCGVRYFGHFNFATEYPGDPNVGT